MRLQLRVCILQLVEDLDADGLVGTLCGLSSDAALCGLILLQADPGHVELLFLSGLGLLVWFDLFEKGDLLVVGVLDLKAAQPVNREGLVATTKTSLKDVLHNEEG